MMKMSQQDIAILAAAGFVCWLILRPKAGGVSIGDPVTLFDQVADQVKQIFNTAKPGTPGYGWKYFDNGVAISPGGVYYRNGVEVWGP